MPAIKYSLTANTITYADLEKIQKPAINSFLNMMGFNKHMPRAVVFGPIQFGGLGTEQGIEKVLFFIRHTHSKTTMGKLAIIVLHNYQLSAGIKLSVLQNTCPLPHCNDTWIDAVRDFLHTVNGSIEMEQEFQIKPLRTNDEHIMDQVLQSNFTDKDKIAFNRCRLYAQVTMISEISDQTGTYILDKAMDPKFLSSGTQMLHNISSSTLQWPNQECPDIKTWRIWKKILVATFAHSGKKLTDHSESGTSTGAISQDNGYKN